MGTWIAIESARGTAAGMARERQRPGQTLEPTPWLPPLPPGPSTHALGRLSHSALSCHIALSCRTRCSRPVSAAHWRHCGRVVHEGMLADARMLRASSVQRHARAGMIGRGDAAWGLKQVIAARLEAKLKNRQEEVAGGVLREPTFAAPLPPSAQVLATRRVSTLVVCR